MPQNRKPNLTTTCLSQRKTALSFTFSKTTTKSGKEFHVTRGDTALFLFFSGIFCKKQLCKVLHSVLVDVPFVGCESKTLLSVMAASLLLLLLSSLCHTCSAFLITSTCSPSARVHKLGFQKASLLDWVFFGRCSGILFTYLITCFFLFLIYPACFDLIVLWCPGKPDWQSDWLSCPKEASWGFEPFWTIVLKMGSLLKASINGALVVLQP